MEWQVDGGNAGTEGGREHARYRFASGFQPQCALLWQGRASSGAHGAAVEKAAAAAGRAAWPPPGRPAGLPIHGSLWHE